MEDPSSMEDLARADKGASKDPSMAETSTAYTHKSNGKALWQSGQSSAEDTAEARNTEAAPAQTSDSNRQQNGFASPRHPPWTKFRAQSSQAAFVAPTDGVKQTAAGHPLLLRAPEKRNVHSPSKNKSIKRRFAGTTLLLTATKDVPYSC